MKKQYKYPVIVVNCNVKVNFYLASRCQIDVIVAQVEIIPTVLLCFPVVFLSGLCGKAFL
ncbi:hypothetical protein ATZ36_12640 [Candidatus Endomicrobiellum trichonymphae]|uniref:Uncharacterized protein n=1 Tax=Endomicrobium trichonymphae TaxID=1408204 RepID=A0A1E5IMY1_ENDTX|nr:hypothetical protein ATZ36_12640 [Candidatus Endomicrobium trichonymphae]